MARRWCADTDYRIGRTADDLVKLKDLDISVPDQVLFQPAASYHVRGNLTRVGVGAATVLWVWDMISLYKLAGLLEFLDGEDNADVYIFTDRRDGRYHNPSEAFSTYSALMWWPLVFGQEGVPVARSPYVMQTVKIQFKNAIFWAGYLL